MFELQINNYRFFYFFFTPGLKVTPVVRDGILKLGYAIYFRCTLFIANPITAQPQSIPQATEIVVFELTLGWFFQIDSPT